MSDLCPICGGNLTLIGRAHNCKPIPIANSKPVYIITPGNDVNPTEWVGEVNAVNLPQPGVNTEQLTPKKRGEYPDTEKRRQYMREYMMKKRRGK